MRSPGINGEGELRGQPANPGSPGKMAVKMEYMCVCSRKCPTLQVYMSKSSNLRMPTLKVVVSVIMPFCIKAHLYISDWLPSDWLERLLWGSLIVARDRLHKAQAEECLWFSWFNVLFRSFLMRIFCPPALHDIFLLYSCGTI